jgi:hypothetical protein
MKILFTVSIISFICLLCTDNNTILNSKYDYFLFKREGGGNIEFRLIPTSNFGEFSLIISRLNFRDTTLNFSLQKDNMNASAFNSLYHSFNGDVTLIGDFKQSTLPTGTWAYLYMVKGNEQIEITNIDLRNDLLNFEQYVRKKLN